MRVVNGMMNSGADKSRARNSRPKLLSGIRTDSARMCSIVERVCYTQKKKKEREKRAFQTVEPNSTCQILPRDQTLISGPNNNIR